MKKHKGKIIGIIFALIVLAVAFFTGGNKPVEKPIEETVIKTETAKVDEESENIYVEEKNQAHIPNEDTADIDDSSITQDVIQTESVETETVEEKRETAVTNENKEMKCAISVTCRNAVGKLEDKESVIPDDGIIFRGEDIVFYEGESVFNVFSREMKKNKIHLEFVNVPLYNSAYIEGIGNLYEFDLGELSGWMYKVNDVFPNYGSSQYILKNGDRIEWVYTCDLGKDVGGEYAARNGRIYE